MAATSTTFNASYVGAVRALTEGRSALTNAADITSTAAAFATKVQTALANPVLSQAKQELLTALCSSVLGSRYQVGAVADATVTVITAAYTTITAQILDA